MASKGVLRTGEAFCLSCNEKVEDDAKQCPSCLSLLENEVKAFACPRCKTVLALGNSQCPKCNLKFKVRTVNEGPSDDDKLLEKLIDWGKGPVDAGGKIAPTPVPAAVAPQPEVEKLQLLRMSIEDLVNNRSEMLHKMEKRLEEEKERLSVMKASHDKAPTAAQAEAEVVALAEEMGDLIMLQAHMESLADEITTLIDSFDIGQQAKEKGLAAKALKMKLEEKEKELGELKAKEEQLSKREEMVDRKIKAYASKKRQLDDLEAAMKERLTKLEAERAELDKIRYSAMGASTATEVEAVKNEWKNEQTRLRDKLNILKTAVRTDRPGENGVQQEVQEAEADLDVVIFALEREINDLLTEKSDTDKKLSEAKAMDEDLKRLLRVLDQLLGQLPEEVIDRFSRSEDFALYERILDKLKI